MPVICAAWSEARNATSAATSSGVGGRPIRSRVTRRNHTSGAAGGDLVAEADILATDAVIRLAYHLFFGKVDPKIFD